MQQELQFDFNSPLDLTKPFGSVKFGKVKEYHIMPDWFRTTFAKITVLMADAVLQ